jgi:hypothetical protein
MGTLVPIILFTKLSDMKFMYKQLCAKLYAFFNGTTLQPLPVYNVSNQKKHFSRSFLSIATVVFLAATIPQVSLAQTTWKGLVSSDWNKASNWSTGVLPTPSTNVIIPSGLSTYPSVLTGAGSTHDVLTVNNLTINSTSGTCLTIPNGFTLAVYGTITTSGGKINATSGTVDMEGSSPQSIGGSIFVSSIIKNLTNSNNDVITGLSISDPLNITGQLLFDDFVTFPTLTTNDNLVLVSNAAGTANVAAIDEDGSGAPIAAINGKVTVERYYPAHRRWRLVTAPVQSSGAPTISTAWQEGGQSIAGSVSNPNPGFGTVISGPAPGAFVSSTGYDQSSTNNASIAHLAAANSWISIPNTTSTLVTDYQGYMLFVRGDRSFPVYTGTVGTLATTTILRTTGALNTGRVSIPVNNGFTVIGNPYAATINFNNVYDFDSSALTSNSFSVWDPNIGSANNLSTNGTGGWVTLSWNGNGYDAAPDPSLFDGFDISGDIQSGSAFAVDGTGSGSVVIDETAKVSDGSDNELFLFRPANNTTLSQPAATLHTTLYATDTAHVQTYIADGVLNEFNSSYGNNASWNKDVKKLFSFNERLSILKMSQNLSIQKSPPPAVGDTIHFIVSSLKQSPYQLVIKTKNFIRPDIKAFLIDSFTNTSTPILLGDTSTIVNFTVTTAPASYAAQRFSIIFTEAPGSVTYTSVTATQENKNIAVEWVVDNQLNINKYVVEKSTDGTNFYPVDTTLATTNSSSTYDWLDVTVAIGDNYYRIRSIDNTGAVTYSKTVDVVLGKGIIAGIQIYPNPVTNGTVELQMNNVPVGEYGIKVIDPSGQVVLTETISQGASSENHAILLNKDLAKGIYILEVMHPDKTVTKINFENQ